jgi:hypothetical protein
MGHKWIASRRVLESYTTQVENMSITIDDFLLKDPIKINFPTRVFDYRKINKLNDSDFKQLYTTMMEEYKNMGLWVDGKIPKCTMCKADVSEPSLARKFCGMLYDSECFKKVIEEENIKDPTEKLYFTRVANIK